jgi:hypothetical protein
MFRLLNAPSLVLLIAAFLQVHSAMAQRAFNDSLIGISERIATRLVDAGKPRVALAGIGDPAGVFDAGLLTYVEEILVMRLSSTDKDLVLLERRGLDQVVEEQKRTASGNFDERSAIDLGLLLAADAIITGSMYRVGERLHLILRMLDTGTGVLIGSTETITEFPPGKGPDRDNGSAAIPPFPVPVSQPPTKSVAPPLELRAIATAASYFAQNIWGLAAEASLRSPGDGLGGRGKASIGMQLSYWPTTYNWVELPFDLGTVKELQVFETSIMEPTVRLGNVNVRKDDLFLIDRGEVPLAYQVRSANGDRGLDALEWQRYRVTNMQTSMAGFNFPLRLYLGRGRFSMPRLYAETGFGMDFIFVRADYYVTSTVVRYDEFNEEYLTNRSEYSDRDPLQGRVSRDLYLTHMTLGSGVEIGRLHLFVQGRFLVSTKFSDMGRSYDRVRGNILALPMIAGAAQDARTSSELARDGVVTYGAMDLEREGVAQDNGQTSTVTGNGVSRFWDAQHLVLGLSFRFR